MSRLSLIAVVALLVQLASTDALAAPKNVLLLIGDDHGMNDASCYGHPVLKTPHLDALAARGARFTHAFATTASCSPSRSVILTGLHNHTSGMYGLQHEPHSFDVGPRVESAFSLLKRAGYATGVIGKKHVWPPEKFPLDFEPRVNPHDVPKMAAFAEQFFAKSGDKPFFLLVGFVDPHRNFDPRDYEGVERNIYSPDEVVVPAFLPDRPKVRADLAEYYRAIGRLDQGIGHVLAKLEASGKADDTLVIYLSDNGMPWPGAKTTAYEPGLRLPFVIRRPGTAKSGVVNDALVSYVDVLPTILEWTGVEEKPQIPLAGRSLLPILEQEHPSGWDRVFCSHQFHEITMYYPMRALRERRYKLIWNLAYPLRFPFASDLYNSPTWQCVLDEDLAMLGVRPVEQYLHRPEFELYDLEADPNEIHNLADAPEHKARRDAMIGELRAFRERTSDPWMEKQDERVPTAASREAN